MLDVSGGDGEDIVLPLAGGKTHPRVRGIAGRLRAAVHVDGAGLLVGADVVLDGDEPVGFGILLFPDAKLEGSAIDVGSGVDLALMFGKSEAVRVPAQGPLARFGVDRETQKVDQRGSRDTLIKVFLVYRAPFADQTELSRRGPGKEAQ